MSYLKELEKKDNSMEEFVLPNMEQSGEFTEDELAEDMDGLNVSFQRIKIPSGGGLQFEIPGDNPEDPEYAKYLTGVILFANPANAYWPEGSKQDEAQPPTCMSYDGKNGHGDPGGVCATCPMNVYGTGKNGSGKACKNMRHLYILRSGEYIPIQFNLPPTSLKAYGDFATTAFLSRRRATYGSVVQIGLKKMNNGKDDYSIATFKRLYDLDGEQLQQIKPLAIGFREQIKGMIEHGEIEPMTDDAFEISTDLSALEPLGNLPTDGSFATNTPVNNGNTMLPQ